MALQSVSVFILVAWCFAYALWTLMPQTARRSLASRLLRWPLPRELRTIVQRSAARSGGCHCDGCDRAAPGQALVFHAKAGQKVRWLIRSEAKK